MGADEERPNGFYVKLKANQSLQTDQNISDSHDDWWGRNVYSDIPEDEEWRESTFKKQVFSVSFSESQSGGSDLVPASEEYRYLHCFFNATQSTLTWKEVAESLGFLSDFQLQ